MKVMSFAAVLLAAAPTVAACSASQSTSSGHKHASRTSAKPVFTATEGARLLVENVGERGR